MDMLDDKLSDHGEIFLHLAQISKKKKQTKTNLFQPRATPDTVLKTSRLVLTFQRVTIPKKYPKHQENLVAKKRKHFTRSRTQIVHTWIDTPNHA
jgi:hypothetical protein